MSASLVGSEMCIRDSPAPRGESANPAPAPLSGLASCEACPWLQATENSCLLYTSDAADDM
eukprot:2812574-Alexandrium_andersonii.AAC.1